VRRNCAFCINWDFRSGHRRGHRAVPRRGAAPTELFADARFRLFDDYRSSPNEIAATLKA